MYLVGIIDVYSRYIVGWSLSNTMTTRWCRECLEEAIMRHGAPEILNTDQGSQFSSSEFSGYFTTHPAIKFSMDGKGSAIDNIFIERFWRSLKYEKIYLEPSDNGLELYHKIKDYMKFYNMERPHQGPDYKRPVTNIHIRRQIKESFLTNFQLAQTFHTSPATISKWRNRETCKDKSFRPHQIAYALNELKENLVGFIRKTTRLPLYEVWEMLFVYNPQIARSSVYRTFYRNHVNRVPPAGKGKSRKV